MLSSELPDLDALAERYYVEGDFTRKAAAYLKSYSRILEPRRQERLAVLELGVSSGASLLCWRDYLPKATIIGIDIDDPPPRILGQERIHFVQGSQDDPKVLDQAAQIAGGRFDMIVDDASHIGYLTKRSLHYLFPRWLSPGGWYVIEDFGTGYIAEYPDGNTFAVPEWADAVPGAREFHSSQYGLVGVVKQLVEHLMQELMTGTRSYMAIERLVIETNIAFIEKSLQPGGPWPGYIPDAQQTPITADAKDVLAELTQSLRQQSDRITELERVVGKLRKGLAPLLWLQRSFRDRRQ